MKKIDLRTLALSCLALGMLFAVPSVQADVLVEEDGILLVSDDEDEDDNDDYLLAGSCGTPGKGGCGGQPVNPGTPNGNGPVNNGTYPSDPARVIPNGGQGQPSQHSCSHVASLEEGELEQARRVSLI